MYIQKEELVKLNATAWQVIRVEMSEFGFDDLAVIILSLQKKS